MKLYFVHLDHVGHDGMQSAGGPSNMGPLPLYFPYGQQPPFEFPCWRGKYNMNTKIGVLFN